MVKVEMMELANGVFMFAFETNTDEEVKVLDNLRVAMLGDFPKQGGYVHGKRLVIEVNPGTIEELPSVEANQ